MYCLLDDGASHIIFTGYTSEVHWHVIFTGYTSEAPAHNATCMYF